MLVPIRIDAIALEEGEEGARKLLEGVAAHADAALEPISPNLASNRSCSPLTDSATDSVGLWTDRPPKAVGGRESAMSGGTKNSSPAIANAAVLSASESMPDGTPEVKGFDFQNGTDYDALFAAMKTMGFQATNLALAIEQVEKMVATIDAVLIFVLGLLQA